MSGGAFDQLHQNTATLVHEVLRLRQACYGTSVGTAGVTDRHQAEAQHLRARELAVVDSIRTVLGV
jgi:hypothetical protein